MAELRLENPGKLVGTAKNAKDYTFYIVLDKPQFTREALESNPGSFGGADLLFKSEPVKDEGGVARLNLADHAREINRRLKDERTAVKFAVLASGKGAGAQLKTAAVEAGSLVMMKPPFPKGTYDLTCNRLGAPPLVKASKARFTIAGDAPAALKGTIDFSAYGYPAQDPLTGVGWDAGSRTLTFTRGAGLNQVFKLVFEADANVYQGNFTHQGASFDADGLKVG